MVAPDRDMRTGPRRILRYSTWVLALLAVSFLTLVLIQVFPVSSGPPSRFAAALLATTEFAALAHLALSAGVGVVSLCVLAIVLKRRTGGAGVLVLALAFSFASAPPSSAPTTSGTAWRPSSPSAPATSLASVTCSATSTSRPPTTTSTPAVAPPNRSYRDTGWDTRGQGDPTKSLVV